MTSCIEAKDTLASCDCLSKEELVAVQRQLAKSERQVEKLTRYNEDLRQQLEALGGELHKFKNVKKTDVEIQVDKTDLLNYTSGEVVLPDWGENKVTTRQPSLDTVAVVTQDETDFSQTKASNTQAPQEDSELSIADSLKATAEAALQQTGFVYDENSGMYYDYNSGYYYDSEKSLYYDPNTGIYYYFDYETNQYQFHSQVDLTCYAWNQKTMADQGAELSSVQHQGGETPTKQSQTSHQRKEKKKKEKKKVKLKSEEVKSEEVNAVLAGLGELTISARKHALELTAHWPPCIRAIVTESDCLEVGSLFIVTYKGGTIGRENSSHVISLPDLNVSRVHAKIEYSEEQGEYLISDQGSQSGTFVNDQRLGKGQAGSDPSLLRHDDVIRLGKTKILCHIHSGNDTCDACEPGIVMAEYHAKHHTPKEILILSKEEKIQQQRQQLKQIKQKYGLKNSAYENNMQAIKNPAYEDKAEVRRRTKGSDSPHQKSEAPASVHRPISSGNIGHQLLKKMGWSEGESLGKGNTGIQEPVMVTVRSNQAAGLGSRMTQMFSADDVGTADLRKAQRMAVTQQRYDQASRYQAPARLMSGERGGGRTGGTSSPAGRSAQLVWTKGETQFSAAPQGGGSGDGGGS